ncbi:bi-domain-containing oxidoreductase [Sediminibacterium sp.]|uniref:bi-domain-containing oxidoreductase n=1 Tax=Sediminibacterium sp. TaxID=1917865 RepID=UPI0027358702|nr:bi-domain-containing oxidoreductase [Sediminibacterium sp.]MDP3392416.1 bi-domain-containing oxidoreductase [Sediminibacterium sp.]MDP3565682.1 bi-domain-containing oxidoreductase [Sediminibacterium sp.]
MKQIIQNLKNGKTILEDVPAPLVKSGHVLIQTHRSLVSLGTERMLVEFGKSSLIAKARQQPDKVKQVLDKIKTEGLLPTLEAVFNKLDEPLPLGYCNSGEVIAVGEGVTEFSVGDRVASNGAHAQFVCVPKNLVAKIPDGVSYEEACFTVIGSIGLQGVRLAVPTIGETFVVIGLGLIGLLTSQLLLANGCRVIGFDFDESKIDLAKKSGVEAFNTGIIDPVKIVDQVTEGIGADAVIITASTKNNEVISQSARMSRKRGRIILIGVIGLDIQRSDFYKKELTFQVSCSYGPGRYDEEYEFKGHDYPLAFVRWTEKRNFETVLQAIYKKQINVTSLITERILLDDYLDIYNNLKGGSIASIIEYPNPSISDSANKVTTLINRSISSARGVVGVIGAGNFTKMTMMPALKGTKAALKYIASAGGLTAKSLANKYGFEFSTTDYQTILNDPQVDLVLITTRHNQHASMVVSALKAGKHVFVEKPLAITQLELDEIISVYSQLPTPLSITVGFNRRFSPFSLKAKQLLGVNTPPINMIATMNAGYIPADVWVHDMKTGGGRIIGEACHFIDLMSFFSGSFVKEVYMSALGVNPMENTDNAIITLKFANGSQGVINYFANGNKRYPKERFEIYSQDRTLVIDNFRVMKGYGFKSFSSMSSSIDKGHKEQFASLFCQLEKGGEPLIDFTSIINTTQASVSAIESLKSGQRISI